MADIFGTPGDDTINLSPFDPSNDRIFGGAGNDYIFAGGGQDTLYGEAGDDTMRSRVTAVDLRGLDVGESVKHRELPVRDLLDGGEGVDSANAGTGQDTCIAETRSPARPD